MTDYSEQIRLPSDYFKHCLDSYTNWQFAWFRETVKNTVEASATQVDYCITQKDNQTFQLLVTDNGFGMIIETMRHNLLMLGGSKNMILFAHQGYQIHTRALLVTGQGLQYSIDPADDYLHGTSISVFIDSSYRLNHITRKCRILAREYQTDIAISLNGKLLKQGQENFEHQLELPVGTLFFNEVTSHDDTEIVFWTKLKGLPLFYSTLYSSGQFNIEGELNLNEESAEFLTANHEGFKTETCQLLSTLFHEISHFGHQLKHNLQNS